MLSFNQLALKSGLSYPTVSRCVSELEMFPEIVGVKRKNGSVTLFKPNPNLIL